MKYDKNLLRWFEVTIRPLVSSPQRKGPGTVAL